MLFELLSLSITLPVVVPLLARHRRSERWVQRYTLLGMPFVFDVLLMVGLVSLDLPVIPVMVGLGLHAVLLVDHYANYSLPQWTTSLSPLSWFLTALGGGLLGVMSLQEANNTVCFLLGAASALMVWACAGYWLGELLTRTMLRVAGCSLFMTVVAAAMLHQPLIATGLFFLVAGVVWRAGTVSTTECRVEDVGE